MRRAMRISSHRRSAVSAATPTEHRLNFQKQSLAEPLREVDSFFPLDTPQKSRRSDN